MAREAACDYPQRTDFQSSERLGARRMGREGSGASLATSRVVWEFAHVLNDSIALSLPGLVLGRERKPHAAVRHLMKRATRRGGGAKPEGCADDDGQLVAAPASEGGRMPYEKL